MKVQNVVSYSAPEGPFQLPPELVELKALVREVVNRECILLEAEYLAGERTGRSERSDLTWLTSGS